MNSSMDIKSLQLTLLYDVTFMIYQPYFRFTIILFMSLEFDIIHLSNGKYAMRLQRLLNSASVVQ